MTAGQSLRWLALSTSSEQLSVAVAAGHARLLRAVRPARGEPRQLTPLIDDALQAAGLHLRDVDAFVCDVGPGTFTGLRHGLALARGLAFALGKPLFGVGALEALLHGSSGPAMAVLAARRDAWYVATRGADGQIQTALVRAPLDPDQTQTDWPLPPGDAPVVVFGQPPPQLLAALGSRLQAHVAALPTADACLAVVLAQATGASALPTSDPLLVVPHYLLASEPEQVHGEVPLAALDARSLGPN